MSGLLIPDPGSMIKIYRTAGSLTVAQIAFLTGAPHNLTVGNYTTVAGDSIDGVIDVTGGTVLTDVFLCDDGTPACFVASASGLAVCKPVMETLQIAEALSPVFSSTTENVYEQFGSAVPVTIAQQSDVILHFTFDMRTTGQTQTDVATPILRYRLKQGGTVVHNWAQSDRVSASTGARDMHRDLTVAIEDVAIGTHNFTLEILWANTGVTSLATGIVGNQLDVTGEWLSYDCTGAVPPESIKTGKYMTQNGSFPESFAGNFLTLFPLATFPGGGGLLPIAGQQNSVTINGDPDCDTTWSGFINGMDLNHAGNVTGAQVYAFNWGTSWSLDGITWNDPAGNTDGNFSNNAAGGGINATNVNHLAPNRLITFTIPAGASQIIYYRKMIGFYGENPAIIRQNINGDSGPTEYMFWGGTA